MSREERIIKHAAKRHHLHFEPDEIDELASGLLFSSHSRTLISARGVVGDSEVILQLRDLLLKDESKALARHHRATLVATPLLEPMPFLVCAQPLAPAVSLMISHVLAAWNRQEHTGRKVYYPPDSAEHLALFERVANHLPQDWCAEGTKHYLQLFKLPATADENNLEEVMQLAGELRPLLVTA